tara:strand:- start:104 stop:487 length:384 start_codon:yes stop_codon:yes gene_type:complete
MQQKPGNNMGLPQEYFLYFKLADNNEAVYPLSALRSVSCSADSKLDFYFDTANYLPTGSTTTSTDVIRCSITADTQVAVMKAFAAEVNGNLHKNRGKAGNYLIVGDEIASAYFHASITAVDSITRAA